MLNRLLCPLLLLVMTGSCLMAADWPQFRHGADRSAASPESLPPKLTSLWNLQLPAPRPAFADENRLLFDGSYEPVVLGTTMFVPSMVEDTVTAIDTRSGRTKWQFVTDGPVRFAPVAWEDKVYAVSDDGFLYCLDAADGQLLWKFRGLPEGRSDRKLLGNQRLISLFPARGGPALVDGTVYFAAGIWPSDGVFVHAVDARTGKAVWSNTDSDRIAKANMDHGVAQEAGLTPQGYLAVVGGQLVVPCGAQLPAFLDRQTGQLGPYTMGWGGRDGLPKGSWFVAGSGNFLSHSGDLYDVTRANDEKFKDDRGRPDFKSMLYPGGFTRLLIDPQNKRALSDFSQPVLSDDVMYVNDGVEGIVAFDLSQYSLSLRSESTPSKFRANDRYPDKWKGDFRQLWLLKTKNAMHIKAGDRLYCGGPGQVQAYDLAVGDQMPRLSWEASVDGTPHRMLAADEKLFVVTVEGQIYAFGSPAENRVAAERTSNRSPAKADPGDREAAQRILAASGVRDGYALVLGLEQGQLVEQLLAQSDLKVIAIDSDSQTVDALRRRLLAAGVYGSRCSVHVGDPATFSLPPYLASLIVSETLAASQWTEPLLSRRLASLLRPYGGVACLQDLKMPVQRLTDRLALADEFDVSQSKVGTDLALITRPGELPAAADWSHAGADAANAAASQDQFLRAPLALLWFDTSLRWHRKPGSAVVRVVGGRVIVLAEELYALDAYTGRRLWEVPTPLETSLASQLAVADGRIYLANGKRCDVLDVETGQTLRQLDAPGEWGSWANLRLRSGYLTATMGSRLVCLDGETGKLVWNFDCGRKNLSTAVAADRIFCTELINTRRGETVKDAGLTMRAFDLRSGRVLWEAPGGYEMHYAQDGDWLVTTKSIHRADDGSAVRDGVAGPQVVGDRLISGTTDNFSVYDLATGSRQGEDLDWYRRGCTGLRSSCHLVTTRFKANAAYVDLDSREITPIWSIRPGCNNNLFPANGLLNVPNVTGGCECNYTPTSKALVPVAALQ